MDELSDSQQVFLDRPKIAAKQIVTFWAKDPSGKREILLDGKKKVYAIPGIHCWHYVQVTVTSRPKPSMYKIYKIKYSAKRMIPWKLTTHGLKERKYNQFQIVETLNSVECLHLLRHSTPLF